MIVMSDLRDDVNTIIGAFERMSLLAQLRDKVHSAQVAAKRECGHCQHWMKRPDCPREPGIGSGKRGPSCGDQPCSQFKITTSTVALQARRAEEAIEFARKHGLPVPTIAPLTGG